MATEVLTTESLAHEALGKGEFGEALRLFQQVQAELFEKNMGQSVECATIYNNMGTVYISQGMLAEAMEMCKKCLDIKLACLGDSHPDIANSFGNMGCLLENQGKFNEAIEMYKNCLQVQLALGDGAMELVKETMESIEVCKKKQLNACGNANCTEAGSLLCSRCLAIKYCSKECQTSAWKSHKQLCKKQ